MKFFLVSIIFGASLVALAQSAPKAVLLEIYGRGASVVGVLENGKWSNTVTTPALEFLRKNTSVSMFSSMGGLGIGRISGEPTPNDRCSMQLNVNFSSSAKQKQPSTYGLIALWKAVPRTVQVIPLSNAVYQKVVADELKTRGIKAPVVMSQIFKTDIDGDGTAEVILVAQRPAINVNAENPNDGGGWALKAYDYALVMVRKVTNGGIKNFVLSERHLDKDFDNAAFSNGKGEPPLRFSVWLSGIADLNGDGKMELLLESALAEGGGVDVYNWNGKGFGKIFEWGC